MDEAQKLFLSKGFHATTVEEICGAAELTKGSFFHYFSSKEDLGKTLLRQFCAQGGELHTDLCGPETDPLKRLLSYIDGMIALAKDPGMLRGCLLGSFCLELAEENASFRSACCNGFGEWTSGLANDIESAKRRYAPDASFDPVSLAQYFVSIVEGSLILVKANRDAQTLQNNLRHFRAYLLSLLGRPEK